MSFRNNNNPSATYIVAGPVNTVINNPGSFPAYSDVLSLARLKGEASFSVNVDVDTPTGIVGFAVQEQINGQWATIEPVQIVEKAVQVPISGKSSGDAIRFVWLSGAATNLTISLQAKGATGF